ncbi:MULTISPECIES: hypothetical protein [unclassified Desulfovibrio]|uniref:hypothetical protein n=1 Tax=unclassified Desulfovibrio TaxID=2593640 RepID=UPI0013EE0A2E|nr:MULTISPECIES: hypothetical protein [unclassified Desulfovibrio]
MCYTGTCYYEDSFGECRKPRRVLCPLEAEDCEALDDSGRDSLCDTLYEQRRDDALMEAPCSCS